MAEHLPTLDSIGQLVDAYRANARDLRDAQTLEATLRQEFLDPFFELLGWDVANRAHRSPAEKDVVIEAPVTTIEAERQRSRRPDYLFRIGGFPRFVVEAKKPSVDLRTDRDAIFQAKTYAWSAQIPFAALTNFETFRLFDATLKPYFDEPQRGVIADFDFGFEDYLSQWDVLLATFGREAVASGSLERLLARIKKVRAGRRVRGVDRLLFDLRGTEPVDRVFLAHLEEYRLRFARSLFEENRDEFRDIDSRQGAAKLTEATQRLIDRLVFVRVCEDREICPWGRLRDALNEASSDKLDLSETLLGLFREFDRQYNGYLFKPHFSEQLRVGPHVLGEFIRSLYPPEGPYRFDAVGDDILGIIYERFLGSVIACVERQIVAEQKPEVRHAGGVYYTPRFVVDTIIRRVIGPKVAKLSPTEVLRVRVLDPACGSGSFLIAAYQFLIDHCTRYVTENPDAAVAPANGKRRGRKARFAFQNGDGRWQLSPDFRARLLTECIFGVDIDAQAVEVTIMSLYLKLLEGKLPSGWQKELEIGRLLPPLDNNICCGNSLLSQSDFDDWWDEKHGALFTGDDDVRFRMNPFDWESETRGFGRLLKHRPGFDCIIGNPPYIRVQELNKWAPDECEFYKWRYDSAAKGNYDIYVTFLERGLELLAPDGLLGFICPHKFWQAAYGAATRKLIADGQHLRSIVDFADQQVFRGATTYTAIHVLGKGKNAKSIDYARVDDLEDGDSQLESVDGGKRATGITRFDAALPRSEGAWVFASVAEATLMNAVEQRGTPLREVATRIFVGLQTSADDVFILTREKRRFRSEFLGELVDLDEQLLHPLLKGSVHIRRWSPDPTDQVVLFPYQSTRGRWRLIAEKQMKSKFGRTWNYLCRCRKRLSERERGRFEGDRWYGYVYPKNLANMGEAKILTPSLGKKAEFCVDEVGEFYFVGSGGGGGGGYGITLPAELSPTYVAGLLNSRLLDWYLKRITSRFHSGWYAYNKQYIERIPIRIPQGRNEKSWAERVSQRSERLATITRTLKSARLSDHERVRLEREAESHEAKIDELVCRLYGVDEVPAD